MYNLKRISPADPLTSSAWDALHKRGAEVTGLDARHGERIIRELRKERGMVTIAAFDGDTPVALYLYTKIWEPFLGKTVITNVLDLVVAPGARSITLGRKLMVALSHLFPGEQVVIGSYYTPYKEFSRYARLLGMTPVGSYFTTTLGDPYG